MNFLSAIALKSSYGVCEGAQSLGLAVFEKAEMIVKVKEPQPDECRMLREGQVLFTYLHLAPDPDQARRLMESGVTAIAYETVTDMHGHLPLLAPMSEVAGRMAVQAGARCLETEVGGSGKLLGGVPGVLAANVVVLGGGVVGTNALRIAVGMEARVVVLDKSLPRLRELDLQFGARLNTMYSTRSAIEEYVEQADLVIGAVLVPGASTPQLVSREMVRGMAAGSVLVDVAIDQGGAFETSRPTTHSDPTFIDERRGALLRGQHAGRGAAHLHPGAQQRHAAVRAGPGEQGLAPGHARGRRPDGGA